MLELTNIRQRLGTIARREIPGGERIFGENPEVLLILPTRQGMEDCRSDCKFMHCGDLTGPWHSHDLVHLFSGSKTSHSWDSKPLGWFVFHESEGGLLWYGGSPSQGPFTGRRVLLHQQRVVALVQEGPLRSFALTLANGIYWNTLSGATFIGCTSCGRNSKITLARPILRCSRCGRVLSRETWKQVIDEEGCRLYR